MITQFVGLKEFRQNLSGYTKKANAEKIRYIVLRGNIPVLEVKALDEKEFALEKLAVEIAEAREQVKRGEVYTQEEIMKEFGLL